MASLNMNGSYELCEKIIDDYVMSDVPGNYALGNSVNKIFLIEYIGRSDTDLKKRLKSWVGKYKYFKFSYALSPREAFEKECKNFHDFGGNKNLNNENHPAQPDEVKWKCPYCSIFK